MSRMEEGRRRVRGEEEDKYETKGEMCMERSGRRNKEEEEERNRKEEEMKERTKYQMYGFGWLKHFLLLSEKLRFLFV